MGIVFSSAEVTHCSPSIAYLCVLCSFRPDVFFSLQQDVGTGSGVQIKDMSGYLRVFFVLFFSSDTHHSVWKYFLFAEWLVVGSNAHRGTASQMLSLTSCLKQTGNFLPHCDSVKKWHCVTLAISEVETGKGNGKGKDCCNWKKINGAICTNWPFVKFTLIHVRICCVAVSITI